MATGTAVSEQEQLAKLLRFLEQDSIHFGADQKKSTKSQATTELISQPKPPTFDFKTWRKNRENLTAEFSSYGIKSGYALSNIVSIGGQPITIQTAMELRNIVSGSCIHSLSSDWKKSSLTFHYLSSPFPYGLQTQRNGSKGVILCLQAYILKHLLFQPELFHQSGRLQPSESERHQALINSMCEMLWLVGERKRCSICLLQDDVCLDKDYRYRDDNITEKLHIFEFKTFDESKSFLKRNLIQFTKLNGCGCLLFLYSVILSRSVTRIKQDMDVDLNKDVQLLNDYEGCTISMINLMLTGKAVQYLHNGDIIYDKRGELLPKPFHGVQERSNIGLLYWNKKEEDRRTEVGSMLKTPKHPIWLTVINDQIGLIFSTNLGLISDWRVEHRFILYYYTGLHSQNQQTVLSIDTLSRNHRRPKTARLAQREDDKKIPPLEQCICTKWYGANINWNRTIPFI